MQYFGGKQRISKPLSDYLNLQLKEGQPFVDLFCGSCNVISKIDNKRVRIANDKHKYLISMWKELQLGWVPPKTITEDEYKYIKDNKDEFPCLTGFVGFGCSYSGKWFGGYARGSVNRNYCTNAFNSTISKLSNLKDVEFYCSNYDNMVFPCRSFIYCDIPYKNTTPYCSSEVGVFNHEDFYEWVRNNSDKHDIYVSEYKQNIPSDFEIVWELNSRKDIRDKNGIMQSTTEVLIRYK